MLRLFQQTFTKLEIINSYHLSSGFTTTTRFKHTIDLSRVPVLNESDLEEEFIKGGGPGGSNVNKTISCVHLKHIPTGIRIKCQSARKLHENRKLARQILVGRLDDHLNGEFSVEAQKRKLEAKKSEEHTKRRRNLREKQEKYKLLLNNQDEVTGQSESEPDNSKLNKNET